MRAIRAQLLALLSVLTLVLVASASPKPQFFCRMMGHVVESCCCRSDETASAQDEQSELRAEDCCERLAGASRGAVAITRDALGRIDAPVLATVAAPPSILFLPEGMETQRVERGRAPLGIGPPLFIAYCSLLS